MRVRWHGMAGQAHSWSFVTQNLARKMKELGHDVFIKSTNGLKHLPEDLIPLLIPGYHEHIIDESNRQKDADYLDRNRNITVSTINNRLPDIIDNSSYDLEIAYSILFQAPRRFFPQSKARALIWNLDNSIFPPGWQEYHRSLDYILPSSKFSFEIFKNNGIPVDKMVVVPHGVDTTIFNKNIEPYPLKTNKKVKIFCNTIQPHGRKLYDRVFKGYLDAFTAKDDVCLVLKANFKEPNPNLPFEIDVKKTLDDIYSKYKNPADIEIINDVFIPNIGSLYTACDIVVNMSSIECFHLPSLEALACGNLVISPRYGGQLDFLNDSNSLLVNTKEMKAPRSHQYWTYSEDAVTGDPSVSHFTEVLQYAYKNLDKEKERIKFNAEETVKNFSWERAAKMILDLPIPQQSKFVRNKRKVLYIIPYNMLGGGEAWVKECISQLDKAVYEPHVGCLDMTSELNKLFTDVGTPPEDYKNIGKEWALKCIMESEKYDIIHFYNSFGVYNLLKKVRDEGLRCRTVETIHSDLIWQDSMMKVAKRDPMVTMMITVSQMMKDKLSKNGNNNVFHLPQLVNWDKFNTVRSKDILKNLGIKENDFVVGFVGRLSPEKNIPVILQCAKKLPDTKFVIVGDGPLKSVLQNSSKFLNNIYFTGPIYSNIEEYYSSFNALLLTSTMEGMPLVVLESMTSGTPVISSNVGAVSEVIRHAENGFIVHPNDINSYVKYIQILQNNDIWNKISFNSISFIKLFRNQFKTANINTLYNKMF